MMGGGFEGMMGSGLGGWGGSGILGGISMVFMGIIPLLVIGLIVWLIVESTRRRDDHPISAYYQQMPVQPTGPMTPMASSGRTVLDERYARGEIEREEYLRRRADMG